MVHSIEQGSFKTQLLNCELNIARIRPKGKSELVVAGREVLLLTVLGIKGGFISEASWQKVGVKGYSRENQCRDQLGLAKPGTQPSYVT